MSQYCALAWSVCVIVSNVVKDVSMFCLGMLCVPLVYNPTCDEKDESVVCLGVVYVNIFILCVSTL